ncbi:MAG: ABC transporter transmembrane domain-containing protein, partial [Ilumatobacter fluminis]
MSAVLPLLRPQAGRWAALGVLTAFGAGLTVIGPLVVRSIVDRAVEGTDADTIRRLAFVFLVIVIAAQVVSVLVARSATYAAWATTNELRMRMARHVLGLDHEFHRQHTPGELIQRVDGDVTSVSDLLGRVLPKAVGSAILVAGMVIVVSAIDWRIGVGMAVYVVAAVAAVLVMRHRAVEESADEMGAYARLY